MPKQLRDNERPAPDCVAASQLSLATENSKERDDPDNAFIHIHRYALFFASRGAKVLVNDLGPSAQDKNKKAADVVVEEIAKAGGEAIANYNSNTEGDKIIQQVIDKWGRVDVVINNAGILRDKS